MWLTSQPPYLASKLIAGEGEDTKALRLILVVKLHQFGVVHVSLASLTCNIHYNAHTIPVDERITIWVKERLMDN